MSSNVLSHSVAIKTQESAENKEKKVLIVIWKLKQLLLENDDRFIQFT